MKETKQWILEAAATIFSKNGFNSATTRAIAEQAGIHESTLFRIYKSKEALWEDLLLNMTPSADSIDVNELTGGADLEKDFQYLFYCGAMLHVRHIPVFRFAMQMEDQYDPVRFARIESMISYMERYFNALMQREILVEFDYRMLAEHINSLTFVKATEFIAAEQFNIPAEQSSRTFATQYGTYFAHILDANIY
ncbi:MAG: TetR/AcrR family transcriptional regulator [Oscillospiraceae bacterium]|nr:TetR/AcrR family transcriptional regulator [Oscillospiraceae bacterium]